MKCHIQNFSDFETINEQIAIEAIDDVSRISRGLSDLINSQIVDELSLVGLYSESIEILNNSDESVIFELFKDLINIKLMNVNIIQQHLFLTNSKIDVQLDNINKIDFEAESIIDLIMTVLEYEMTLTDSWNKIASDSLMNNDALTYKLAQDFISGQMNIETMLRYTIKNKNNVE